MNSLAVVVVTGANKGLKKTLLVVHPEIGILLDRAVRKLRTSPIICHFPPDLSNKMTARVDVPPPTDRRAILIPVNIAEGPLLDVEIWTTATVSVADSSGRRHSYIGFRVGGGVGMYRISQPRAPAIASLVAKDFPRQVAVVEEVKEDVLRELHDDGALQPR